MKKLMSTWDKWSLVQTLLVRMAICENIIACSITLLRDLLSFENWSGGWHKGFVVGHCPPPAPLSLRPWSVVFSTCKYFGEWVTTVRIWKNEQQFRFARIRHHFSCGFYVLYMFIMYVCLVIPVFCYFCFLLTRYFINFYLFFATNVKQLVFERAIAVPCPTQFYGFQLKFYCIKWIAHTVIYMGPLYNLF